MVKLNDEGPVSPASFGELLRRTREGAGLRIEDIVAETKVSKAIFESLEAGLFYKLPERVFCRSFVVQYARTVGVEEGPLRDAFDQAWDEFSMSSGTHPNVEMVADDLGPTIRWRFWLPIAAGVLILLVAAAVILRGSTSPGEGLAPDPRRSGVRQMTEAREIRPEASPTPRSESTLTEIDVAVESMVKMILEVGLGEECWIHYRDSDGMTGQQLLANGQQVTLELAGPVKLTVGNAGAVMLTVDDRIYRDLGLPGQVIHTEVTREHLVPLGSGETVAR